MPRPLDLNQLQGACAAIYTFLQICTVLYVEWTVPNLGAHTSSPCPDFAVTLANYATVVIVVSRKERAINQERHDKMRSE